MLTQDQKEAILRSAGIDIPDGTQGGGTQPRPSASGQLQQQGGGAASLESPHQAGGTAFAAKSRALVIDTLFKEHVARRAAKSLDEAEASTRPNTRHTAREHKT